MATYFFIPTYCGEYTIKGTQFNINHEYLPSDYEDYSMYIAVEDCQVKATLDDAFIQLDSIFHRHLSDDDFFDYVPDFINQIIWLASCHPDANVWNQSVSKLDQLVFEFFQRFQYSEASRNEFDDAIGYNHSRHDTEWKQHIFQEYIRTNPQASTPKDEEDPGFIQKPARTIPKKRSRASILGLFTIALKDANAILPEVSQNLYGANPVSLDHLHGDVNNIATALHEAIEEYQKWLTK